MLKRPSSVKTEVEYKGRSFLNTVFLSILGHSIFPTF